MQFQVEALPLLIIRCVVLLDKRAGTTHHKEPHQLAPIISEGATLKGAQGTWRHLCTEQLIITPSTDVGFRPNPEIALISEEEAQLGTQIEVRLIVGCCGEQNDLALLLTKGLNVVRNSFIATPLRITERMGFIDHNQLVARRQLWKLALGHTQRDNMSPQIPIMVILLPHRHQVLRTDNHWSEVKIITEDPHQGARHHRLPQANDITEQHPTPLIEVTGGNLDRSLLEREEFATKVTGQRKLIQTSPRLLGQVVGHLEVDMVGAALHPSPTLLQRDQQFPRDIDRPLIVPTVIEPRL